MEKLNFNYSLKNIPIPDKKSYLIKLVDKIESVVKRMRWKAYFYLQRESDLQDSSILINGVDHAESESKEFYGFKSSKHPGPCKELESFEKELIGLINKIEFKTVRDQFQSKLKSDISKVKCSKNLFVFADKTSNIYELSKDSYDKLLAKNVTKTYKKPQLNSKTQ